MAVDYMDSVVTEKYPGTAGKGWEYSEELQDNENGNSVIIPPNVNNIAVTLEIDGTATAKIQVTTNRINDVIDEAANVVWVDWDSGAVGTTTQDFMVPATALRLVKVSGAETTERARLYVRAQ